MPGKHVMLNRDRVDSGGEGRPVRPRVGHVGAASSHPDTPLHLCGKMVSVLDFREPVIISTDHLPGTPKNAVSHID